MGVRCEIITFYLLNLKAIIKNIYLMSSPRTNTH